MASYWGLGGVGGVRVRFGARGCQLAIWERLRENIRTSKKRELGSETRDASGWIDAVSDGCVRDNGVGTACKLGVAAPDGRADCQ